MFFNKKSQRIENISKDNIIIVEIYKKGKNTFKLFCDVKKSSGSIALNTNYCVEMLTQNGFFLLADNRQLCIPELSTDSSQAENLESIEAGFNKFKTFADLI